MTTMEIASMLVELCRQRKDEEAVERLFAQDAVSVEPVAPPGQERETRGRDAIRAKGCWFREHHDIHTFTVSGPWPHDDRFIVGFEIDATNRDSGERHGHR